MSLYYSFNLHIADYDADSSFSIVKMFSSYKYDLWFSANNHQRIIICLIYSVAVAVE